MSPAPSLQDVIQLVEAEADDISPLGRLRAASVLAAHLADVGDAALGYFVDQARRTGHSWSQIGDALGVSKQAAQQKQTARHASSQEESGLERFTPRARNAVSDAHRVAREWGHDYIGTEHLLLALYRDPHGLAAVVLATSGLGEDQAAEAIAQHVKRGGRAREGKFTEPFTPKAKGVLDAARSAAGDLGHTYVGTEHLLLGLVRSDGVAKQVLEPAGLTTERVSDQVAAQLARYEHRGSQSTDPTPWGEVSDDRS
jgi:Clp amino terminal domain, pathogenicity island component